ncbi:hypothetical protein ARMSODRAFT_1026561 [Armillaria solidipes]|uniref:Uncharacterized protein n=1 Tax=Armillaria solidipes TaxID=1076256 RepID=A0A2H3B954_9AGAR|nr:hypothetical protein ARMSODRAFT_1026561 [Armillaria solidipes]
MSDLAAETTSLPAPHRSRSRPRKYKTPEERAAAHAVNQQAYYDRNRDKVCRRVRRRYHQQEDNARTYTRQKMRTKPKRIRCQGDEPAPRHSTTRPKDSVEVDETPAANIILRDLDILIAGQDPALFVAGIYAHAVEASCPLPAVYVGNVLAPFTQLDLDVGCRLQQCYQREGCTPRWKTLDEAVSRVKECVSLLQDLLCSAMFGAEELREAWNHGALAYQNTVYELVPHDERKRWIRETTYEFDWQFPHFDFSRYRHQSSRSFVWGAFLLLEMESLEYRCTLAEQELLASERQWEQARARDTWGRPVPAPAGTVWDTEGWGLPSDRAPSDDSEAIAWAGNIEGWGSPSRTFEATEGAWGVISMEGDGTGDGTVVGSGIRTAEQQPIYSPEQHGFLGKKSIFYHKVKRTSIALLQQWLEKFFMEWFLLYPEDTRLTGFDLEAAQAACKKDLLKMLQWSCWMWPDVAAAVHADKIEEPENDEARLLRLDKNRRQEAADAKQIAESILAAEEREATRASSASTRVCRGTVPRSLGGAEMGAAWFATRDANYVSDTEDAVDTEPCSDGEESSRIIIDFFTPS